MKTLLFSATLFAAAIASAQPSAGLWDATVTVNNIEIPFRLELSGQAPFLTGAFFNGDERVPASSGRFESDTLLLTFDQYGARLEATWKDGQLTGTYVRGKSRPYPFQAVPAMAHAVSSAAVPSIDGLWEIPTRSSKGEAAWHFVVQQKGAEVSATILRVDGDTGSLQGGWRDGKFVLSHFDGTRPLRLEVTLTPEGKLELVQNGKLKLTAIRPAEARAQGLAEPTDAAAHTSVKDPAAPFHFSFPDLNGRVVSDTDPRFQGKVVIVAIGGSWCPNCHDEARFLQELYAKYHSRGLEIVGLFFEEVDVLKDPARVRAFIQQYGLQYPMLLAGETSELQAKVPQAANLDCWPTTFFLGRDGKVKAVHAGFAGRASGVLHDVLVKETSELLENLLAEDTLATAR